MNHKDIERLIPSFLDESMDDDTLEKFLDHIEKCPSCKEELTVQFLLGLGMSLLETGETFNLSSEMNKKLKEAHERLEHNKRFRNISFSFEVFAILFITAVVIMAFYLHMVV
ncbi:anti-sigma factor family protein [Butyrivibrio sp. MC2013]|uniref:anti-sigma factor family protein n=1 Tax=Butyrivibrio sp. MC2013 TaxID=1280686 RepID=UPI0003FA8B96|nr:zf-HC2 domain-containing protein [Butyrivibrio sp. MC2013]